MLQAVCCSFLSVTGPEACSWILIEPQSEPVEDDELDMEVDSDGEGEDGDDIDVVGDDAHDDEGVVDDKDVVEEDIEDELIDVRYLRTWSPVRKFTPYRTYRTQTARLRHRQLLGPLIRV